MKEKEEERKRWYG
jgi:hypothetical protein